MATRPSVLDLGGNSRELQRKLRPLIGKKAAARLEADLQKQVKALFALGRQHLAFAKQTRQRHWRQVVSRAYYGAYSVSRAVRLQVHGEYSRDVKDHQKFDRLPDDFKDAATYSNKLELLRDDRNICDYDHQARVSDLASTPADTLQLVSDFIGYAKVYLRSKGLRVR